MVSKRKSMTALLLALILTAGCLLPDISASASVNWLNLTMSVNNKYEVKIKWNKKSVDKYTIYRATYDSKSGDLSKYKKIASLSGEKSSYVDKKVKKNTLYYYVLKGYRNSKLKYRGENSVTAGLADSAWDEYIFTSGAFSPTELSLVGYTYAGMKPDGFKIYRSENGSPFKRIKTVKPKSGSYGLEYVDKTVEPGHTYSYKFRTYKVIGNQTIYGPYSEVCTASAVHAVGHYTSEIIAKEGKVKSIILKLIPDDPYNGTLGLSTYTNGIFVCGGDDIRYIDPLSDFSDNEDVQYSVCLHASQYSLDGKNWTRLKHTQKQISSEGPIYIKLQKYASEDGSIDSFYYEPSKYEAALFTSFYPPYRNLPAYMSIDVKTGITSMGLNYEYIH